MSKSGPGSPAVKTLNLNDSTKSPIQHLLDLQSQLNIDGKHDLNARVQLTRWGMKYTRNRWSADQKKGQINVGRPTDALIIGYHQVNQKGSVAERVFGGVVGARIGTPVSGAVGKEYIYLRINPLMVQDSADKYRMISAGQHVQFYYAFLTFEIRLSNLLTASKVFNKIKAASIPGGWRSADSIWWTRYGKQGPAIKKLVGKADGLIKALTFQKIILYVFKTQKPTKVSSTDPGRKELAGLRYNTLDQKGNRTERKKLLRATSPASIALWNADKIEVVDQMIALNKKNVRVLFGIVSGVKAISLTAGGYGFNTFEGLQSDSGEQHIEHVLEKLNNDIKTGQNKVGFEEALHAVWPLYRKSTRWLFDVIFEPTYVLPDDNESGVHRTRNSIYYNMFSADVHKQPKQTPSKKIQNNAVERALKGIIDRVRELATAHDSYLNDPVVRLGNAIQYNWGSLKQPNPLTMDEIEAIVSGNVYPKTKAWKQMLHFGQTGLEYLFRGVKGKNKIVDLFSEMHKKTTDPLPYRDLVDGVIVRVVTGTLTLGPPLSMSSPTTPKQTTPKTTVFSSIGKSPKRSASKTPVLDRKKLAWLDGVIDPLEWMMFGTRLRFTYNKLAFAAGKDKIKQAEIIKQIRAELDGKGKNKKKYESADRRVFVLRRIIGYDVTAKGKPRHVKGYLERIQDEVKKADKLLIGIAANIATAAESNQKIQGYVSEANKIKPADKVSPGFMKAILDNAAGFQFNFDTVGVQQGLAQLSYNLISGEIKKITANQAKIAAANSQRATAIYIVVRDSYANVLDIVVKIWEAAKNAELAITGDVDEGELGVIEYETEILKNYKNLALAESVPVKLATPSHPSSVAVLSTPTKTTTTTTTTTTTVLTGGGGGGPPSPIQPLGGGGLPPSPLVLPTVGGSPDPTPLSLEFWDTLAPLDQENLENSSDDEIQTFITKTMEHRRKLSGPIVPIYTDIDVVLSSSPPSSPTSSSSTTTSPTSSSSSSTTTSPTAAPLRFTLDIATDFNDIIQSDVRFKDLLNKIRAIKPTVQLLGFDYGSFMAERQKQHDVDASMSPGSLQKNRKIALKKVVNELNASSSRASAVTNLRRKTSWFRINKAMVMIHEAHIKASGLVRGYTKVAKKIKDKLDYVNRLLTTNTNLLETTEDPTDSLQFDSATQAAYTNMERHSNGLLILNNEVQNDAIAMDEIFKKIEQNGIKVEGIFKDAERTVKKKTAGNGATSITIATFTVAETKKMDDIKDNKAVQQLQKGNQIKVQIDAMQIIFQDAFDKANKTTPIPTTTPSPTTTTTPIPSPTTTPTTTPIPSPTTTPIPSPTKTPTPSPTKTPTPTPTPTPSPTVVVVLLTDPPIHIYPHDDSQWLKVPQAERDNIMLDINGTTTSLIDNQGRINEAIEMVKLLVLVNKEITDMKGLDPTFIKIQATLDNLNANVLPKENEKQALIKASTQLMAQLKAVKIGKKNKKRKASRKKGTDAKVRFDTALNSMDHSLNEIVIKRTEIETFSVTINQNIIEAGDARKVMLKLNFLDNQRMVAARAQGLIVTDNVGLTKQNTNTMQTSETELNTEKAKLEGFLVRMRKERDVIQIALTELIPPTAVQAQLTVAVNQLNLIKFNLSQTTTDRRASQKNLKTKRAAYQKLFADIKSNQDDVDVARDEATIAVTDVLKRIQDENKLVDVFRQKFAAVEALKKQIRKGAYVAPVLDKKEIIILTETAFRVEFGTPIDIVFDQVSLMYPDVFVDRKAAEIIIIDTLEIMMPAWAKEMIQDINLPHSNPAMLLNQINQTQITPYVKKELGKPAGLAADRKMDVQNAVYTEFYSMQRKIRSAQMSSMIEGRINSINVPLEGPFERSLIITFDDADATIFSSRLAKITIKKPVEMDFKSFTITDPLGLPRRRDGSTTVLVTGFANNTRKRRYMLGGSSYEWTESPGGPGDTSSRKMSMMLADNIDVVVKIKQGSAIIKKYDILMETSLVPSTGALVSTLYRMNKDDLQIPVGSAMGRISQRGPDHYYDVIYFFFVRWH